MTRFYKWMTVVSVLVPALLVSCTREKLVETDSIATEARPELSSDLVEVEFIARLEDSPSKTTLVGTTVKWSDGDQVKFLWDGSTSTATARLSGEDCYLTAYINPSKSEFWAVYPAAVTSSYSASTFSVTVPYEQDGSFEKANIMVAYTTNVRELNFKNLCGLIKFTVTDPNVRGITISGKGGEALAGTIPVTFNESGLPVAGVASSTSPTLTLLVSGAGTYYAAVLPGTDLTGGFDIELSDMDGPLLSGVSSTNRLTMTRSCVQDLGSLNARIQKNWFVTPEGGASVKDGTSWEKAFSWSEVASKLNGATTSALQESLSGSTFHFRKGTYKPTAMTYMTFGGAGKGVVVNFIGGYDDTLTGTDLSARTPRSTIFTTNEGSTFRLFRIANWARISWDGITVQNVSCNDGYNGGAVAYVGEDASLPAALYCHNCLFTGNSATANSGGCFYVGNARFTAENCDFERNSAPVKLYAGAVFIRDGATGTFSNCRFNSNHAYKSGGAIYIERVTEDTNLTDCTFTENSVEESGNWGDQGGGAITIWESSVSTGTISMERCTFDRNSAENSFGGAVFISGANTVASKIYAKDCVFTGNYSNGYGGAWCGGGRKWSTTWSSTLRRTYMDGCKFIGNYVTHAYHYTDGSPEYADPEAVGNGHAIGYNQGWLALNNCAFWDNGNNDAACKSYVNDIYLEANCQHLRPKAVLLMVNTTVISHSNAQSSIRVRAGDAYINIINSLLVCPTNAVNKGNSVLQTPTSGQYTILSDNGSSVFSGYCSNCQTVALGNYSTWKAKFTDGYKWDGSGLDLASSITSAKTLSSFCSSLDASKVVYDLGPELAEFARFNKDIDGKVRNGQFTPGCWQVQ